IGCDAVSGVDVNKTVASMVEMQSSESTMSLSWEVDASPSGDKQADRLMNLFGSGSIQIDEALQEDSSTQSMKGTIELSKGEIPFELYVSKEAMVLDIEGTKQPFILDLAALSGGMDAGLPIGGDALTEALSGEAGMKAISQVVAYVLS